MGYPSDAPPDTRPWYEKVIIRYCPKCKHDTIQNILHRSVTNCFSCGKRVEEVIRKELKAT